MFAETLTTIVNGEITQLFSSRSLVDRAEYDKRIYAKTASLFELSASAAAMLSPVDTTVVEKARRFGYSIGMAFQLVDDILDFTGQASHPGQASCQRPAPGYLHPAGFVLLRISFG